MKKLALMICVCLLAACSKEPADVASVPADYDLQTAIQELPVDSSQEKAKVNEQLLALRAIQRDAVVKESSQPTENSAQDKGELAEKNLLSASEKGDFEQVKALLEAGADKDIARFKDTTALIWASCNGHTQLVKALLAAGAEADYHLDSDDDGTTALRCAARKGYIDIVKLLLAAGADVDNSGMYTGSVIANAAHEGHKEIVALLLASGADVNDLEINYAGPALLQAARQGHTEIVKLLLAKGADTKIKDDANYTALMWAQKNGYAEIVELLKAAGAKE